MDSNSFIVGVIWDFYFVFIWCEWFFPA